jgi:nitrite reductase (NO-forming)
MTRDAWHLRANIPTFVYLVAAAVVAATQAYVDDADWLIVHLLALGAASNAILVWSAHFTQTLLRLPADVGRRSLVARIALLNVGIVLVLLGLTLAGATLVGGVALWHAWALWRQMGMGLPARFRPMVRYYVAAACFLPVGAGLGVAMERAPDQAMLARLLLAHMAANVLGWIGITVAGTLVTLWPTILRTQIAEGAERAAGRALPILVGSVLVIVAGSAAGLRAIVLIGLAGYLAGWIVLAGPHARAWRRRPPHGFASWSVLAAVAWLGIGLARAVGIVMTSADWTVIAERLDALVVPFAVGFAAQVLLGALTYLIPVVLAGGPEAARRTIAVLETAALPRLVGTNVGLVLLGVPWFEPVRTAGWLLTLVSMAAFLPIAGVAVVVNRRVRRTRGPGQVTS